MKFLKNISNFNLVLIGNGLELFDLYLYIHLSFTLQQHFFPYLDDQWAKIFALSGLYFISPLASLFWGYRADNRGRREILVKSAFIMAIATSLITLVPEYKDCSDNYKYLPLVLLFILRMVQAFAMAGEPRAAKIYSMEAYTPKCRKYFIENKALWNEKFVPMAVTKMTMVESAGGLIALLIAMISLHWLNFLSWSWRIPFIFATFSILFVAFIRRQLTETNEFKAIVLPFTDKNFKAHMRRVKKVLINNKYTFVSYIILSMSYPILFTFNYTFLSPSIIKAFNQPKTFLMQYNAVILFLHLILEYISVKLPIMFNWDKKITMSAYHLITIGCIFFFMFSSFDSSIWLYASIQAFMMAGITWNLIFALITKNFHVLQRFTCMSIGSSISAITQYLVFCFLLPLFLDMANIKVYGCCCVVAVFIALYAIHLDFIKEGCFIHHKETWA